MNDAIKEMVEAGAFTRLPRGQRPTVVSPIGVVAKPHSEKFRLVINTRYVNKHLAKKVFKFEGLGDLADIAEKGDHSVSYDLKSAYYHVGLHPMSRRFVGIKWEGVYYEYTCLAFGLSTAPWVFSKVMRELVMYWRRCGIRNLPYLDDLFFPKKGSRACRLVGIRIEGDCFKAGLLINFEKSGLIPLLARKHLGFEVDLGAGYFRVLADRWEALQFSTDALLMAKGGRVLARKLASLVGTVISMRLAWGPVCQLYTRHLYALLNTVWSLNCWVSLSEEAVNELLFWQQLPRLRFEKEIWPSQKGVSIKVATDAIDFAWGGHTLGGPLLMAREYFTWEESVESSTFRELLGVLRCLQALVHLCRGKFVVVQVDAQNLLGIINRDSSKLAINKLARDLFWFGWVNGITLSVEWVPREENAFADELSKLLIPDDWMLAPKFFNLLEARWGPHTVDLFASSDNAQCEKLYSLHWCHGSARVNAFGFPWSGGKLLG